MLLKLPDEIVLMILGWLKPIEMCVLSLVNKQLLDLCRDTEYWKCIFINENPKMSMKTELSALDNVILERMHPTLTTVTLIQKFVENMFDFHIEYQHLWHDNLTIEEKETKISEKVTFIIKLLLGYRDYDNRETLFIDGCNIRLYRPRYFFLLMDDLLMELCIIDNGFFGMEEVYLWRNDDIRNKLFPFIEELFMHNVKFIEDDIDRDVELIEPTGIEYIPPRDIENIYFKRYGTICVDVGGLYRDNMIESEAPISGIYMIYKTNPNSIYFRGEKKRETQYMSRSALSDI